MALKPNKGQITADLFTVDTGRGKSPAFLCYTTIFLDYLKEETFYDFFFFFVIPFCNIWIMLPVLIHKGKGTEMILQIAPVTL